MPALRVITTRTHGVLDYAVGALLIVLPWLLGVADGRAAQWVPQILGGFAVLCAAFTDYELGLVRAMPVRVHLLLDIARGALLAVSPWLFGFAGRVIWPYLLLGAFAIAAALLTQSVPGPASRPRWAS